MSKLTKTTIAAAFGFMLATPLYAADTPSTQSNPNARSAMEKCNKLTGAEQAKCVVNVSPQGGGGSSVATKDNSAAAMDQANGRDNRDSTARTQEQGTAAGTTTGAASGGGTAVKDGSTNQTDEYAAAVKECEAANAPDKDRCIEKAKEHHGRM